jgi:hypothetical protein
MVVEERKGDESGDGDHMSPGRRKHYVIRSTSEANLIWTADESKGV